MGVEDHSPGAASSQHGEKRTDLSGPQVCEVLSCQHYFSFLYCDEFFQIWLTGWPRRPRNGKLSSLLWEIKLLCV